MTNASEKSNVLPCSFDFRHSQLAQQIPHNISKGHQISETIANRNIILDSIFTMQLRKYEIHPSMIKGICIIDKSRINITSTLIIQIYS